MHLKPGSRWKSAVGGGEFVVIRPPSSEIAVECAGQELLPYDAAPRPEAGSVASGSTDAGKRYSDADTGLELLCTKGGQGDLSVDGRVLKAAEAKKLPTSD